MRNFFVTLVFALLSSVLLAQTTPARPTVIALPLQAGPGLKADEVDLGYAVQNVIENVLLVHGGLDYQSIVGQQRSFFASADDLTAWAHGRPGAKEPMLNASNLDVVLHGRVLRKGETLLAEVELWDRRSDKRVKRDLAIDLPALVSFRQGVIGILTEAGLAPGSKQRESMLWREDIGPSAFRLLSEGVGGDLLAGYGDKPQPVTPLETAVKLNPQSYLLQNWFGWLNHRNQQYDAAEKSFARAITTNAAGIDALDGMMDFALRGKDIASAESYARRKAEVRGEVVGHQFSDLYRRVAANAWEEERFKDAIDYLQRALPYLREGEDRAAEAEALNYLASSYCNLKQYDKAIGYYEQVLRIVREVKHRVWEANTLSALGGLYSHVSQHEKAIDYYEQALPIRREVKDRVGEASTLSALGDLYSHVSEYEKAIGYYEQALPIVREMKDQLAEAETLNNLGLVSELTSHYDRAIGYYELTSVIRRELRDPAGESTALIRLGTAHQRSGLCLKAMEYYERALPILREVKDRSGEAATLSKAATCLLTLRQYEKAVGYYEQALPIRREVKDKVGEAATLNGLGEGYAYLRQPEKAASYYEQELAIQREMKDRDGEAATLSLLGLAWHHLTQYERAIGYFNRSLTIMREVNDRAGEAATLTNLGWAYKELGLCDIATEYFERALLINRELKNRAGEKAALNGLAMSHYSLGQHEKAIGYNEQALAICRELKDQSSEAVLLDDIGLVFQNLSLYDKAVNYHEQALLLRREVQDRAGEAVTLNNLGLAYVSLSQYDKAIGLLNRALLIEREVGDRSTEGTTLGNLGSAYEHLSQYARAIGYFEQALAISREVNDVAGEAVSLGNLGGAYHCVTQYQKAIEYIEQALALVRKTKDRAGEGAVLNNLGAEYRYLSQPEVAIGYFESALVIEREVKDRAGEGMTLNNMGRAYDDLNRPETAIRYYEQALPTHIEVKNRSGEGMTLSNLGLSYGHLGQFEKAVAFYEEALVIEREIEDRAMEAKVFGGLMLSESSLRQSRLAIFYGKQAVNVYQSIRNDIRGLSKELRKNYLASNASIYRNLATLLAQQGRVWEAEQVLLLLKDEETFEFIGEASKAGASREIALSPHEEAAAKRDRVLVEKLIQLSERADALNSKKNLTTEEQRDLTQMRQQLETEASAYKAFLNSLESEFGKPASEADVAVIDHSQSIASRLEPGAVAVYTIASDKSYISLFFTPNSAVVRDVPITYGELDAKVKALRQALMNNSADPRPHAQELYSIIVGPIAADLDSAHADTILWSLDGPIRHVPIAALYDGRQYLIEKYKMAMFSSVRATGTRSAKWDALALGVSKEHKVNGTTFPQLSGVPTELRAIVREKDSPRGVLPGIIKLDDQFTWSTTKSELERHNHTVVHIASHFEFDREKLASSFLLLGDGSALPLNELRNEGGLFRNVDLLALSACNTATEGDGREVDSFAKIAQDQGAASVLATLWPVYDPSTSALMSKFYALHESSPTMTKAEALREAQLALLHGSNAAAPSSDRPAKQGGEQAAPADGAERSASPVGEESENRRSRDPNDYSHPYFWAPFILMGNWK